MPQLKVHEISHDAIRLAAAEGKIEAALDELEHVQHLSGVDDAKGRLQAALSLLYEHMDDEAQEGAA